VDFRERLRTKATSGGKSKEEQRKMGKGLSKDWTAEKEALYESYLVSCHTFAERDVMMTPREHLKYEGDREIAGGGLRLATATDEELEEVAKLEGQLELKEQLGGGGSTFVAYRLKKLKKQRAEIREKGIKRSELVSS